MPPLPTQTENNMPTIKNEKQAYKTFQSIVTWLEDGCQGAIQSTPPEDWKTNEIIARDMAIKLLKAGNCDGLGGCLLCQD